MSVKLIVLDCYGIVLSRGFPDTVEFLHKRYGGSKKRMMQIIYYKYFNQAALGKISQPLAWQKAIDELKLPLSWRELHDLHISLLKINKPAFNLAKILSKDYQVIILSKNTRMQMTATKSKHPQLEKNFLVINARDINLPKASEQTVKYLLKKFRVKPNEVVFCDDQRNNLVASKKLGLKTVFYQSFPQFKKELLNYLE
jgi:putative hydrolase of the HAD superfamily